MLLPCCRLLSPPVPVGAFLRKLDAFRGVFLKTDCRLGLLAFQCKAFFRFLRFFPVVRYHSLLVMFYDTHVHFDQLESANGIVPIVERANEAGVGYMIAVGGSSRGNVAALAAANLCPENIAAAVGFDRDKAPELSVPSGGTSVSSASTLVGELNGDIERARREGTRVVAIGEIGLDFHYSPETSEEQVALFSEQLTLAGELDLPVIVHSRDSEDATISELRKYVARRNRAQITDPWGDALTRVGVLHCFAGTKRFADELIEMGFCISFSGIITFKNASALRDVARSVPEDRLLIETDSPYLAPEPHRGKPCEPMYLPHVAQVLAEVRGCSVEKIADVTTNNARRLFSF